MEFYWFMAWMLFIVSVIALGAAGIVWSADHYDPDAKPVARAGLAGIFLSWIWPVPLVVAAVYCLYQGIRAAFK